MTTFRSALTSALGKAFRMAIYAACYAAIGNHLVGPRPATEPMWVHIGYVLTWPVIPANEIIAICWLFAKYAIAASVAGLACLLIIAAALAVVSDRKP